QDEFFDSTFVECLEPGADGRIVDEKDAGDFLELHTTIKEKNGVRPAGDAMLLQPIPGDLHQVGPIRRAEEIAVRLHPMTGIDPGDSVKRFSEVRGIPLYIAPRGRPVRPRRPCSGGQRPTRRFPFVCSRGLSSNGTENLHEACGAYFASVHYRD